MKNSFLKIFFGIFSLFILGVLPFSAKAEASFGQTVKIVAYHYLLNGQLSAIQEGSGTLISESGEVLTNAHVVMDEDLGKPLDAFSICVVENSQDPPECRYVASLKKYDEKIDLAVLQINTTPVWGEKITSFPYLPYNTGVEVKDGEKVTIRGFSASGGVTLNTTQGQISGFEQTKGFTYLKTDADIDAGNSGGTMLDEQGNFIGVPTYVVSYLETSGRALHISEIKTWLESETGILGVEKTQATEKLKTDLKQTYEANASGKLLYVEAPGLVADSPKGWHFQSVTNATFNLIKDDSEASYLQANIVSTGFKSTFTDKEKMALYKSQLEDDSYSSEMIQMNGKNAFHFWLKGNEGTQHFIFLDHDYHTITLSYFVPKNDITETQAGIDAFLATLKFSFPDVDDAAPTSILNEKNYPFTLKLPSDWRIVKDQSSGTNLAMAGRNNKYSEILDMYYYQLTADENSSDPAEGLQYDLENYIPSDAKVIFKNSDLKIDGLPGWIFVYSYTKNDKKMEAASASILDPEYNLYFDYEAEETIFEDGLKGFIQGLKSFKSKRYAEIQPEWKDLIKAENQGVYNIPLPKDITPVPEVNLTDIAGHRYEENIKNLVALGVINGNPNGTFDPEGLVNRAATLKIILQSVRAKQIEEGTTPFVMPANFNAFLDVTPELWYATYVAEGVDKGIVKGYPDGKFKGENTVNLAEALKMALVATESTVWSGDTEPWYKKYFDAAYQLELLPPDLKDPAKLLTRAELAYIVDQLISK